MRSQIQLYCTCLLYSRSCRALILYIYIKYMFVLSLNKEPQPWWAHEGMKTTRNFRRLCSDPPFISHWPRFVLCWRVRAMRCSLLCIPVRCLPFHGGVKRTDEPSAGVLWLSLSPTSARSEVCVKQTPAQQIGSNEWPISQTETKHSPVEMRKKKKLSWNTASLLAFISEKNTVKQYV